MSPFYYGVELGLYRDRNLDVTISPASGTAAGLQQLVAGNTQMVVADLAATVKLMAKAPDVKLKSYGVVFAKSSQTIFYLKGTGINEPKDLEGKTIATSAGSNEFALFPAFAEANGIDQSKVNWKVVDSKIKVGLLLQKTVDATSTTVFGLAQLEATAEPGQEIGYFQYGDYGVNLYGASLVVNDEWASQHADAVEAFVQATQEAFTAGLANPDASIAAMKKAVPTLDEGIAAAEMKILPDVMMGDAQKEHGIMWQDADLVKATYDEAVKEVGSAPPLPYTDYFSNDYLVLK
jgi:NitT/TauT family transport system substrate-binding protein